MNTYSSLRKQNRGRMPGLAFISLFVLLTGIILASRILNFSPEEKCHYIPLTKGNGLTNVSFGQFDENGDLQFRTAAAFNPNRPVLLAITPLFSDSWYRTTDEDGVWKGQTDIDIFRVSYENGQGKVTVNGQSGEKVLAPGTSNCYSFALENTGNDSLRYEMKMEAYFGNGNIDIPVEARVFDHNGNYLAGSSYGYDDVLDLNYVVDSGTLKAGYVMPYTLEWQWPFEGDDAYDTMLGNLAVDKDLTLTIVIKTLASYTPAADGGIPKTGDTSHFGLMLLIMVTSSIGLLLTLLPYKRKGDFNEKA